MRPTLKVYLLGFTWNRIVCGMTIVITQFELHVT